MVDANSVDNAKKFLMFFLISNILICNVNKFSGYNVLNNKKFNYKASHKFICLLIGIEIKNVAPFVEV